MDVVFTQSKQSSGDKQYAVWHIPFDLCYWLRLLRAALNISWSFRSHKPMTCSSISLVISAGLRIPMNLTTDSGV